MVLTNVVWDPVSENLASLQLPDIFTTTGVFVFHIPFSKPNCTSNLAFYDISLAALFIQKDSTFFGFQSLTFWAEHLANPKKTSPLDLLDFFAY